MRVCLHDRGEIEAFLKRDPGLYVYLLGDLDPFFWPHTSWYGWRGEGGLDALSLLYSGDELPVLLAFGGEAQGRLLNSLQALLPRSFYSHLTPGLETALPGWVLSGGEPHLRMLLTEPDKLGQRRRDDWEPVAPTAEDVEGLHALFAEAYPHNWFNARMLETGQYLGLRRDGRWLAIAGVHVYAPEQGVAALGNITVHPSLRGQGLGGLLTGALCRQLLQSVPTIGLNVHAENAQAIRCYRGLGFELVAEYREWMCRQA